MTATVSSQSRAESTARLTLLVVLSSETILFGTLLMVYLYMRANGSSDAFTDRGCVLVPLLNTAVLLLSTGTAWWSNAMIRQGQTEKLKTGLLVTLVLGLVFVGGQVVEFSQSGMQPDDQAYGGVFFTLIGFHAVHVLIGVLILAINTIRAQLGDFSARRHIAVDVGTWFWYYVAGVWIVLFAALYLL